jgi:hypothetical protein
MNFFYKGVFIFIEHEWLDIWTDLVEVILWESLWIGGWARGRNWWKKLQVGVEDFVQIWERHFLGNWNDIIWYLYNIIRVFEDVIYIMKLVDQSCYMFLIETWLSIFSQWINPK